LDNIQNNIGKINVFGNQSLESQEEGITLRKLFIISGELT
jgi:hypothetical protein